MTWPTVRLKNVSDISVSNVDKKSLDGELSVQLCNYVDVYYHDRITADIPFMDATATPEQIRRFGLRRGDVLFTKDSETADDIAVPAFVPADLPGVVCGYHLAIARPRRDVDGRFLYWSLCASSARDQFGMAATGVTRFGLRQEAMAGVSLQLPGLAAQRAIADFLDAETARIDDLIGKLRESIRLVNERQVAEVDRLLDIDIRIGTAGVPAPTAHTAAVRVGSVASIRCGLTIDSGRPVGLAAETPYLRVANVQDGSLDLDVIKSVPADAAMIERFSLKRGDVLMTEGGDIDKLGRGAVWDGSIDPCLHQNHVFAVRPSAVLVADYLSLVTTSRYGRAYFESTASKTTGIASTSASRIASFRIPLPLVTDQQHIVMRASAARAWALAFVTKTQRRIALLQERRQALITAAVTGELDVAREIAEEAS